MLAKLEMELNCEEQLNYQMSSLFHGVLMEQLEEGYAEYLHLSQLHPYTQHLEYRNNIWYWVVCCLNETAVDQIIHHVLEKLQVIKIKKHDIEVSIGAKSYEETSYRKLMDDFYEGQGKRYIQIHFISPTAFKQNGRYLFYPDIRCIFQSLMNKYDAAAKENSMIDADTLEELCRHSQIIRYDLKSVNFSVEGVKIPSFIGKITIKMSGTKTMANFANMLFRFGEYSGIGIKTALGMGCTRLEEERGSK